jgi:hypothetical protein
MKESEKRLLAACGLVCTDCDIYKIPFDDEVADHMVKWFKAEGWLEETAGVSDVIAKGMYCKGCHGDRAIHWDAECWILVCCVDERGLDNCSQCDVFPCERLAEWAAGNSGYLEALNRLQSMAESGMA